MSNSFNWNFYGLTQLSCNFVWLLILIDPGSDQSDGMFGCFHRMVSHGQSTTWQSPSLSRLNTWQLSSSLNPSAHLALFFLLWRYPPSDAMLTLAISPKSWRLVEGGSILFLPVQVLRTCPLPPKHSNQTTNKQTNHQCTHHAFHCTSGWRCQEFYWCIIKDLLKRQHHHRYVERKDTKTCRETPGTNTRNGQVHLEHSWTLWNEMA